MTDILLLLLCLLMVVAILLLVLLLARSRREPWREKLDEMKYEQMQAQQGLYRDMSESMQRSVHMLGESLGEKQEMGRRMSVDMQKAMENRLSHFAIENETKLENIRATMEKRLFSMQQENAKKLDEMRGVVDEKLQRTLDERMTQSFALVNERLEQVYKGLGEMQSLAVGVGDLKRVLSGVKTRGILGEVQLGAILEEILAPGQYERNFVVHKDGKFPVEFAVKMPGADGEGVYLPIDSKFPLDAYTELLNAYESGQTDALRAAQSTLKGRVREFAKAMRQKYIEPPYTTDFAIMFVPAESLYAELVKLDMPEQLQRESRVSLAGPSTMAALLNSLQMGFRTLAIQKRSGEVWKTLSAVRTEFERFEETLKKAQERIVKANSELDQLIGVRTRQIRRSLRNVSTLSAEEMPLYLPPLRLEEGGEDGDA